MKVDLPLIALIVFLIAAGHFCLLRGDNLAMGGFYALAALLIWPEWPAQLLAHAESAVAEISLSAGLKELLGAVIIFACALLGVRYVLSLVDR